MFSMRLNAYHFLLLLIFYTQYELSNTKPLIGQQVEVAQNNTYSFAISLAAIGYRGNVQVSNHLCTGILLSEKDVLTAEHCFEELEGVAYKLLIGSVNLNLGESYYIYWMLTFDRWSYQNHRRHNNLRNDIVIIRLQGTTDIPPVIINPLPNSQLFDLNVIILGWSQDCTPAYPNLLKVGRTRILPSNACIRRVNQISDRSISIPSNFICSATMPPILMSKGDSGGPTLFNNTLVAINVALCPNDLGQFHPELVNIHMNIHPYVNFIQGVVAMV